MARYIPKSKVNILETAGSQFITATTKQIYVGTYMELSDGTFFVGNNPQNPGERLIRRKILNTSFGQSRNNSTYRRLQKPIYEELSIKSNIPVTKPDPQKKDYERGYFLRYFCRRINDAFNYFNISKETYEDLKSLDDKYDYNLHIIGEIKWALLERSNKTVANINNANINLLLDQYPNLNTLFNSLAEYEPLHTRNFTSKLYKKDKTLYTGYFHVHPTNGALMENPFHSDKPHEKIFTIEQLKTKKIRPNWVPTINPGKTQMGSVRGGGSTSSGGSSGGSTSSGRGGY